MASVDRYVPSQIGTIGSLGDPSCYTDPSETFSAKEVQQLTFDLGGPLTPNQIDGYWGNISRNALKEVCAKYGLLHDPRQPNDYCSSTTANGAMKVKIRPVGLIKTLKQVLANLQKQPEFPYQPPQQQISVECQVAINQGKTIGAQLDQIALAIVGAYNTWIQNPTPQNEKKLVELLNFYENIRPSLVALGSKLAGCGYPNDQKALETMLVQFDNAVKKARTEIEQAAVPPEAEPVSAECASAIQNVQAVYDNLGKTTSEMRALAVARDSISTFRVYPDPTPYTLPVAIAEWPNTKNFLNSVEAMIVQQCGAAAANIPNQMRVIRDSLEEEVLNAQAMLAEPAPVPSPPAPIPAPVAPTPPPVVVEPAPAPVPVPIPPVEKPLLPQPWPWVLGGAALSFGLLTALMITRRRKEAGAPAPATAGYGYY